MQWDVLVTAWLARLNADTTLTGLLGGTGNIYPADASRPVKVPSLQYLVHNDHEEESFNPMGLRVDLFVRGATKAAQVERRVRQLSHRDAGQVLGTRRGWLRLLDASTLEFPSDPGVVHRALDFHLETVRSKYNTGG